MPDNVVKFSIEVTDNGTMRVFDQLGTKLKEVKLSAEGLGKEATEGLAKFGVSVEGVTGRVVELATGSASAAEAASGLVGTLGESVPVLAAVAAGFVAVGVAVAGAVASTIRYGNELNEISRRIGVSGAELSKYYLVAQAAGLSLQDFGAGVQNVNRELGEAANGAGRAARLFAALGVTAHDPLGAIRQLADAFQQLPDGIAKSDAAQVLFAGNAEKWIKIFEQGSKGIDELIGKNAELNNQLTGPQLKAIEDLDDAWHQFWATLKSGTLDLGVPQFLTSILHILTDMIEKLRELPAFLEETERLRMQLQGGGGGGGGPDFTNVTAGGTTATAAGLARERAVMAALGRPAPTGTVGRERRVVDDLDKRIMEELIAREKEREALLEGEVKLREQSVEFAEDDLKLAQQSGATAAEQLAIAQQLDALETQRLTTMRARVSEEMSALLAEGPVLDAEFEKLINQADLLDASLARGPDHVKRLTAEFQRANDVVIDLAATLNDSLRRVIDGILNSATGFDFTKILQNVLKTTATTIIGGTLQAWLQGGQMQVTGVGGLTELGKGLSGLWQSLTSARPTGGGEGTFGNVVAGGSSTAAPGDSRLASAASGIGTAVATYGAAVALDLAVNGADRLKAYYKSLTPMELLTGRLTVKDIANAVGGGGIVGAIGAAGEQFDPFNILKPPNLMEQLSMGLGKLFQQLNLPIAGGGFRSQDVVGALLQNTQVPTIASANVLRAMGFAPPPSLEERYATRPWQRPDLVPPEIEAARRQPALEALRSGEALALGVAITRDAQRGLTVSNLLTNNFEALGLSVAEARREMRKVAEAAGLDFIGGLESINKALVQHKLTIEQATAASAGWVKLMSDTLPIAVADILPSIVQAATTAAGGIDIAQVQAQILGRTEAIGLRRQIADVRLGMMTGAQQSQELYNRIAALDRDLMRPDLSSAQREQILQQRAQYGFQLEQLGEQRFAPGTAAQRAAVNAALAVVEESAKQLDALGTTIQDTNQQNTTATQDNTEAIKKLTDALTGEGGLKGAFTKGDMTVTVVGDADPAMISKHLRKEFENLLRNPKFKGTTKTLSVNR